MNVTEKITEVKEPQEPPVVSVIIPTYKHQDYILKTLESVWAQTFRDYEIIVINDGSPDKTAEVLKPLAAAGKIRYIEQANTGQSAARNRGIADARGTFIALLDDDDIWPADKLERQVGFLRDQPETVLVYGIAIPLGEQPREDGTVGLGWHGNSGWVHREWLEQSYITSPGQTLIRASALREIGGFDPDIWGVDDWDLYIRLSAIGQFYYDRHTALHYRIHTSNASRDFWRMYRNAKRLQTKHLGSIPRPGYIRTWMRCGRFIGDIYFGQCSMAAQNLMAEKKWSEAARQWISGFRLKPSAVLKRWVWKNIAYCWLKQTGKTPPSSLHNQT